MQLPWYLKCMHIGLILWLSLVYGKESINYVCMHTYIYSGCIPLYVQIWLHVSVLYCTKHVANWYYTNTISKMKTCVWTTAVLALSYNLENNHLNMCGYHGIWLAINCEANYHIRGRYLVINKLGKWKHNAYWQVF